MEVFRRIDKPSGGSGRVDARELGVALKMLGQRFSREQARDKRQALPFALKRSPTDLETRKKICRHMWHTRALVYMPSVCAQGCAQWGD